MCCSRLLPLLALGWLLAGCADPPPQARNLLLITIDTLRADRLGIYGYAVATSPSLDALAREAVVFDNAQAQSSWTLPSLASVMTSLYPSTHGCVRYDSVLDPSFPTLGEMVQEAGFLTAAVTNHVFLSGRHGMNQGFAHFDDELVVNEGVVNGRGTFQRLNDAITSDLISDKGIAWLRQIKEEDSGQRWMLWLHYFDPHRNYRVHDGFKSGFDLSTPSGRYDSEIAFTDHHVGRVLDELQELGLADDTAVVFAADHGEEFGEHGFQDHGWTLFREALRVPFMVRAPGIQPGRVGEVVRLVDVLPTALDLLGLPLPPVNEGTSLLQAMRGQGAPRGMPALAELALRPGHIADSVQVGEWKLVLDYSGAVDETTGMRAEGTFDGPRVLRDTDAVSRSPDQARSLLFDLSTDLGETRNVAQEHPDVAAQLKTQLLELLERASALVADGGFTIADSLDLSENEKERLRSLGYLR
ncbi:MAG: sulfatase [Planctomycetes bacterium]|nr:sulfatase [Planctomycetota bacterium]